MKFKRTMKVSNVTYGLKRQNVDHHYKDFFWELDKEGKQIGKSEQVNWTPNKEEQRRRITGATFIYRNSLCIGMESDKEGTTEVRVWVYSEDKDIVSHSDLENKVSEIISLAEQSGNSSLNMAMEELEYEEDVAMHRDEIEAGMTIDDWKGFIEFKREGTTVMYTTDNFISLTRV